MLSKQAIEEFTDIYLKEFGLELSFKEASEQALNLLRLYKTIVVKKSPKVQCGQKDS